MLKEETIKKEQALSSLSDEQVQAIVTLSRNDEQAAFSERFSEIHNALDAIVREASGIEKGGTEKTSEYLKRVLTENASTAQKLTKHNEELSANNAKLEEQISAGSADKELIASQKATIDDLRNKYNNIKAEKERTIVEYESKLTSARIDAEIKNALASIALNTDLNSKSVEVLKAQAIANVKSLSPTFVGQGNGETLIFRDNSGAELRNPDNQLNLYTAKELLTKELEGFGILAPKQQNKGSGGNQQTPKPLHSSIGGVSTQTAAMDAIANELSRQGIVKSNPTYQQEFNRLWNENNISSLPLQ